ncbi:MAG TPA: TIGR03435 family protein [Bryobacteraceae bacterium]|nr:TIGR03435 family protein [Bryobacteraceae bacterium]
MRPVVCLTLGAAAATMAFAQPAQKPPAFDAAEIHASPHSSQPFMSGGILRGGRYVLRKATMVDLIRTAYAVEADNVVGGPAWLESDRFDITAKIPPDTSPETAPLMLQRLLAERFKLAVHNDTKPVDAFVLSMGKGKPKLKEAAEGAGAPGCTPQMMGGGTPGSIRVSCHNVTMAAFALQLHQMAGGYLTMPVVDKTGLQGSWDVEIAWTARGALQMDGSDGISIFDAVEKLGLHLEAQKVSEPVIVVDSVDRKPTDNPANIAQALPPAPPAEFEVADIKPSAPGTSGGRGGFQPGGRIDLHGVPLRMLITLAWDLLPFDDIPGAPKFIDTANFDLVAKASTTMQSPGNGPPIEIDDLRMMLRKLLADRFKLTTHYEDRPVNAYTLVAAKPKLKKADPSNRTRCKTGPTPVGKDPAAEQGPPLFQAACQNMTMAQFAEQLQNIAPLYIRYPVQDSTGLEGAWDFTINFTPVPKNFGGGRFGGGGRGVAEGGGGGPRPDPSSSSTQAAPMAAEPTSALTLFDAVSRQLGLKLEMQKRNMPVLVIDHIEEKPTDN